MDFKLQLVFICASIFTFGFVIYQIRKQGLNIEDSISWILWSVLLLVFSFFPQISTWLSRMLGFMSTSNFILCLFIFFLYIMVYSQMIKISKLKAKQIELIQKISLMNCEKNQKEDSE